MADELACPLGKLAEHLSARPMPEGVAAVADWLDYSLNRCGLIVVAEQSLTRTPDLSDTPERISCDRLEYGKESYLNAGQDALSASGLLERIKVREEALRPFAELADGEVAEQFTDGTIWMLSNGERRYGAITMRALRVARTALNGNG